MLDKTLGTFKRTFNCTLQTSLKSSALYSQKLVSDIRSGEVFPAFRNGAIDFYHKGGKLFEYTGKFATHVKYATVLDGYNKWYIREEDLHGVQLIKNFDDGYSRIKENCALYTGIEASGVADIYKRSGYLNTQDDIVVLDIEVSLQALDAGLKNDVETEAKRTQDRIDLLLYNRKTRVLCFFEAKHYSNKELWSTKNTNPPVVKQLKRYNNQLAVRHEEILREYKNYIEIARQLFEIPTEILPDPVSLEPEVVLLVFGFDSDQKNGRLETLLVEDSSLAGLQYRFIGNPTCATDLWTNIKRGE